MSLLTAAIIDAVSTDADALRRVYKVLAGKQQGIGAVEGDLKVTTSGGMVSVIAAGDALIQGTQNSVSQGTYGVTNDANISQTHSAADPTNPRNDLVGIKIEDAFYSGTNKQATAVIITGTPAPSPVDPATPANYLPLARVRVNAGASTLGTITDLRPRIGLPFHAEVYRNAALNIPNTGLTTLAFDTIEADPNNNFNTGTGLYTCPLSGLYRVTSFAIVSSTPGQGSLVVIKNGTNIRNMGSGYGNIANAQAFGTTKLRAAVGDTLGVQMGQNSTTNPAAIFTGAGNCWAQFEYVGP